MPSNTSPVDERSHDCRSGKYGLPYTAVADVLSQYAGLLDGRVIVDITNPLDFETFDSLVVPVGSSAAEVIAETLPGSSVLKAFNPTFAATLTSGKVGTEPTTVPIAGDDADAALAQVIEAGGLRAVDVGALKRAHELEALGFLQLTLAGGARPRGPAGSPWSSRTTTPGTQKPGAGSRALCRFPTFCDVIAQVPSHPV